MYSKILAGMSEPGAAKPSNPSKQDTTVAVGAAVPLPRVQGLLAETKVCAMAYRGLTGPCGVARDSRQRCTVCRGHRKATSRIISPAHWMFDVALPP